MKHLTRAAAGALLAVAVVAVGATPAQADNPSISRSHGTAKWIDLTDQLCVKVSPQAPAGAFAEALIFDGDTLVKRKGEFRKAGDSAFTCTKNLSIPEDKRYRLVVTYSNSGPMGPTLGASTMFYS